MNLCVSKWLLARKSDTERIVGIACTIRIIEIEQTCIRTIIVIASTFEERITRVREVRVVQFNP